MNEVLEVLYKVVIIIVDEWGWIATGYGVGPEEFV